jgi:hypothetical protein
LLGIGVAIVQLDLIDLKVCRTLYNMEPCSDSLRAISDDNGVTSSLWSDSGYDSWSGGASSISYGRPSNVIGGRSGGIDRVSQLKWPKSGLGIAPFLVIFLPAKDFALVARVAIPVDVTVNVMELVDVASNVFTMRLIDLLVDIRVGITRRVAWVDHKVASHPPEERGRQPRKGFCLVDGSEPALTF